MNEETKKQLEEVEYLLDNDGITASEAGFMIGETMAGIDEDEDDEDNKEEE